MKTPEGSALLSLRGKFISNSQRKALDRHAQRLARQPKRHQGKHALVQGDPNTPGRSPIREPQPERKRAISKDPTATPKHIADQLATMSGVTGNHSRRNDFEHMYFRFHNSHGVRLRAKYRP